MVRETKLQDADCEFAKTAALIDSVIRDQRLARKLKADVRFVDDKSVASENARNGSTARVMEDWDNLPV